MNSTSALERRDSSGATPLHYAACYAQSAVVKEGFQKGLVLVGSELFLGVPSPPPPKQTVGYIQTDPIWEFPKIGVPDFGVFIMRILLFRVP